MVKINNSKPFVRKTNIYHFLTKDSLSNTWHRKLWSLLDQLDQLKGLKYRRLTPLTLSLLGYLKTRICWGGSIWPLPSKSHVWCPNMTNDTSLESSCALLLESAKKICKFLKIKFFIAKSSFIVNMFAKKNLSKKWQIIHFWKALDHAISNMQKFLQNFK